MNITYYISLNMTSLLFACIRIHIFSPVTSCFLQLRGYMHVHEHYLLHFIKYDVIIICMYTYTHFFPSHILFSSTSWLYACT